MTMVRALKKRGREVLEAVSAYRPAHAGALVVSRLERAHAPVSVEPSVKHLQRAITWIKRAQDAVAGGGVSWGYRARVGIRSEGKPGWEAPYPETTGYIIPTMIRYAKVSGDAESSERARRMAEWEAAIQLSDGGFQGGVFGSQPVASSTFVTGQVLFGLVAAFERFQQDRFRAAAVRAGDWL